MQVCPWDCAFVLGTRGTPAEGGRCETTLQGLRDNFLLPVPAFQMCGGEDFLQPSLGASDNSDLVLVKKKKKA